MYAEERGEDTDVKILTETRETLDGKAQRNGRRAKTQGPVSITLESPRFAAGFSGGALEETSCENLEMHQNQMRRRTSGRRSTLHESRRG